MRHMYVIGQTGTGKSVYLKNMIIQDIKNGNGLCFIDPHGQDVQDILKFIPKDRIDDVIYFDPSDLERPLGLNLLEAVTEEEKELVANIKSFFTFHYSLLDHMILWWSEATGRKQRND